MQRGDYEFPYKWERGRKFGVQSSNTLRKCPWVKYEPDTLQISTHPNSRFINRHEEVSLDKHKLWEELEEEQFRQSRWQSIHKQFGYDPDDYDPNTRIIEHYSWPSRSIVVVNGNKVNRTGKVSPPEIVEEQPHENTSKTVSRASQKRKQQRMKALQQHSFDEPKDGQQVWHVQRNRPDLKMVHERQYSSDKWGGKWGVIDGKTRRLELKKQMKKLHQIY